MNKGADVLTAMALIAAANRRDTPQLRVLVDEALAGDTSRVLLALATLGAALADGENGIDDLAGLLAAEVASEEIGG